MEIFVISKLNASLIKGIYMIGASAALMQGLLAVMMAGMNAILGLAQVDPALFNWFFWYLL